MGGPIVIPISIPEHRLPRWGVCVALYGMDASPFPNRRPHAMTDPRLQQIKETFATAAGLSESDRAAFLEQVGSQDPELRREVESLLDARPAEEPTWGDSKLTEGPGSRIGPYKLLELIGEGGFGVVFMAEQSEPVRRRVALKIVKLGMDTKQVVARFEQERQALALMEHPNIAKVLDAGTTASGRPYFVMELVRGEAITQYCDRAKLPMGERLELFVDVCRAVQHAHHKGVIHRDIKPSNVLVTLVDGKPVPKVIDFGVAKAMHAPLTERTLFTEFRQMIGTPLYMSPEQAEMSAVDVDTRSDLYSLGVLLYELLTGTTPLTRDQLLAGGVAQMHRMIREVEPPKPSTRLATLGQEATTVADRRSTEVRKLGLLLRGDLDWIVMKCLEKDRTRRYATPTDLLDDVRRHLDGAAVEAAPPSAAYRLSKFVRRNRGPVAAAAAVILTAFVGLGALTISESNRAREATQNETDQRRLAKEATDAQRDANEKRELAEAKTREAIEARDRADMEAYIANIAAADAALRENEIATVRRRLDACPEKLRNWEWRHLNAQSDNSLDVLLGHEQGVVFAAYSPDGLHILTASLDGTARIWDAASGKETAVLRISKYGACFADYSSDGSRVLTICDDHTASVLDAATGKEISRQMCWSRRNVNPWGLQPSFSPDGTRFVTYVGLHLEAKIIDAATGNETFLLDVGEAIVESAAFSPDGTRLVTGGSNGTASLWDAVTGKVLAVLPGHNSGINFAAFSPDGSRIVTASWDRTARIWNAVTGEAIVVLRGPEMIVNSATFSPDGCRVVVASDDKIARLWDALTGEELAVLRGHKGDVNSVAFSPDGSRVVTASSDGTARLWDALTGEELAVLRGHEGDVNSVAFSPDGSRVVTASSDGTARLWDAATRNEFVDRRGPEDSILFAAFSSDGTRVLATNQPGNHPKRGARDVEEMDILEPGGNGTAIIYDVATTRELLRANEPSTHAVCFSPDGKRVVTTPGRIARIRDAVTWDEIAVLRAHKSSVFSPAFNFDGSRVVTVSLDMTARIWDAANGSEIAILRGHEGAVGSAAFSPDGSRVVTTSVDKTARLWDVVTGEELAVLRGHESFVEFAAFSSDGDRVVTLDGLGTGRIFDVATRNVVALLRSAMDERSPFGGLPAAFSFDGTHVVIASQRKTTSIWEVASGKEIVLRGHEGAVRSAAFSPDGSRVVTAAEDGNVRIWETASGREIVILRGLESPVKLAAFSPDGTRIVTVSSDSTIRIWDSVPYRQRFPRIKAIRTAIIDTRKRVFSGLDAGKSLDELHRDLPSDASLNAIRKQLAKGTVLSVSDVERTGAAIVLCELNNKAFEAKEMRAREAESLAEAAASVVSAPDGTIIAETIAKSLQDAARAVELDPSTPRNHRTLGAALFRAGRFVEALKELQLARDGYADADYSTPAPVFAFLAMSHAKLAHKDEALAALEKLRILVKLEKWKDNSEVLKMAAEAESVFAAAFPEKPR